MRVGNVVLSFLLLNIEKWLEEILRYMQLKKTSSKILSFFGQEYRYFLAKNVIVYYILINNQGRKKSHYILLQNKLKKLIVSVWI